MASLTFTLSTVPNNETNKVEILACYRNTCNHYNRLRGKIYKVDDDSKSLLIAFERETCAGRDDLADALEIVPSSVAGETLGDPIKLKP